MDKILVGKIALRMGFITEEELNECIRIQESTSPPPPLGRLLVQKGYISHDDMAKVILEQEKALAEPLKWTEAKVEEMLFGKLAVKLGMATAEQLNECLRIQAKFGEQVPLRIGEIMARKGYLTREQVVEILNVQHKEVLACPTCRSQFNVSTLTRSAAPRCAKCGTELHRMKEVISIHAEESPPHHEGPPHSHRLEHESVLPPPHQEGPPAPTITTWREDAGEAAPEPKGVPFGRYYLAEELGRGGMGVVYRAFDTLFNRYVALKMLVVDENTTQEDIERFHREAYTAAKLRHPNIIGIHDVGMEEGKYFFTMDLVNGPTLADLLSVGKPEGSRRRSKHIAPTQKPMPLKAGLQIIREVALALDYAHRQGIIHRDIKPSNIMVDGEKARTVITDFGLAKEVRAGSQLTLAGTALGTPEYMSPEQAQGKVKKLDARTDIYSLGAVLYEVLAGRPPFTGESAMDIIMKVATKEPFPPSRLNKKVPRELEAISMMAMAKDPSRRYQSAAQLATDLRRFLDERPLLAQSRKPSQKK